MRQRFGSSRRCSGQGWISEMATSRPTRLGGVESDPEGQPGAPVVGDDVGDVHLKRIEQGDHDLGPLRRRVPADRRTAPPEPRQVHSDHAPVLGQRRDGVSPGKPVLRKAVQQKYGGSGIGARFDQVKPGAADGQVAMQHAGHRRDVQRFEGCSGCDGGAFRYGQEHDYHVGSWGRSQDPD